jgi:hypothetical protein
MDREERKYNAQKLSCLPMLNIIAAMPVTLFMSYFLLLLNDVNFVTIVEPYQRHWKLFLQQ